jgi:hypothetical protein
MDERMPTPQRSETGEIDNPEEIAADTTGARAGQLQEDEELNEKRTGIANDANFGTE